MNKWRLLVLFINISAPWEKPLSDRTDGYKEWDDKMMGDLASVWMGTRIWKAGSSTKALKASVTRKPIHYRVVSATVKLESDRETYSHVLTFSPIYSAFNLITALLRQSCASGPMAMFTFNRHFSSPQSSWTGSTAFFLFLLSYSPTVFCSFKIIFTFVELGLNPELCGWQGSKYYGTELIPPVLP